MKELTISNLHATLRPYLFRDSLQPLMHNNYKRNFFKAMWNREFPYFLNHYIQEIFWVILLAFS